MLRRRLALGLSLLLAGPSVIGSVGHVFEAKVPRRDMAESIVIDSASSGRVRIASNGGYSISCAFSLHWLREIVAGSCRIESPPR